MHPTQPIEIFRNVSTPFCTAAIRWSPYSSSNIIAFWGTLYIAREAKCIMANKRWPKRAVWWLHRNQYTTWYLKQIWIFYLAFFRLLMSRSLFTEKILIKLLKLLIRSVPIWHIGHPWWRSTVVRTSVIDRRTFPGLRHDVLLMGNLLGVNRPLYVSQHGQLSHSFSWGR